MCCELSCVIFVWGVMFCDGSFLGGCYFLCFLNLRSGYALFVSFLSGVLSFVLSHYLLGRYVLCWFFFACHYFSGGVS